MPANFGPLKGANANARVLGPCGDTMEFWLWIENERIVRANYTTDGCIASIVSGAVAGRLAAGKTLDEACGLTPEQVEGATGGLPENHQHCPVLALKTLRTAIDQYRQQTGICQARSEPVAASPGTRSQRERKE